jgi:MFS-type transporter involved in bile tolerance (Atg22 family)
LTTFGYFSVLYLTIINPVIPLICIAICNSFITTYTLAEISRTRKTENAGVAFGFVEVLDAFGSFAGNLSYGYLAATTKSYFAGSFGIFLASLCGTICLIRFSLKLPLLPCCISSTSTEDAQNNHHPYQQIP